MRVLVGLVATAAVAGGIWSADRPCTVAVSVVKSVGPVIPLLPAPPGKFFPPSVFDRAPDLPPEAFSAYVYDRRHRERGPVGILSVERDSGPRRIAMVVGGLRLQTEIGQPMLQAVPVAIERILSKARPQDSFALLTAGGPPVALPFGSGRDAIRLAVERIQNSKEWKRGGKGVLDALVQATARFGSPHVGDSIILFGGLPREGRARISELRATLTTGHIRLHVFSGVDWATTGGDMVSGEWVRPLAWICDETGGDWEYVGYAGARASDENLWMWRTEADGLYEVIKSVYTLRLERTGPNVTIDLSPQFREQIPRGVVIYPRPLPVCP
jgi:hypothetical protein